MSVAARRSHRGDEYQLQVATHWVVQLLSRDDLEFVKVEVVAMPDDDGEAQVDDIAVRARSGADLFIQAKKNQTDRRAWSFSDLREELHNARDQLENSETARVEFYSRTPFGELEKLVEDHADYEHHAVFAAQAPDGLKEALKKLASTVERSEAATFGLLKRLSFGAHHTFDDWDRLTGIELSRLVTDPTNAQTAIERLICSSQAGLRGVTPTLRRADVLDALRKKRIHLISPTPVAEIELMFRQASAIGRQCERTIGGERIARPETAAVVDALTGGKAESVLVKEGPGTGKTCVLLDVVDHIEAKTNWGLLFIKGDQFAECGTEAELAEHGLPSDIIGMTATLARERRTVVVIDSLDVLSLHREHRSLRLLLSLIDRLEAIPNVAVVTACRSFDLTYDALLRDRKWSKQVQLEPLEFDHVVAPLLERIGIEVTSDAELQALLTVPQNLRIYVEARKMSDGEAAPSLRTAYDLQRHYLETVVGRDELLGPPAMTALMSLAQRMLTHRVLRLPKGQAGGDDKLVQRLVSQKVLTIPVEGSVQFTHQSLLDSLAVRAALENGQSLTDFITSQPPFPFLRPIVRSFIVHLRTWQSQEFARQIRKALGADIAYHLKRTIVETIAELPVSDGDWPLVRSVSRDHDELFRRMLWRVRHPSWFRLLIDHWWSGLSQYDDGLRVDFMSRLDLWMNDFPAEALRLWLDALKAPWGEAAGIAFRIQIQLKDFEHWQEPEARTLLETLQANEAKEREFLGEVLSRYVEATNDGDDLLWAFICQDVDDSEEGRMRLGDDLKCQPHEFHTKTFVEDRLIKSPTFLTAVMESIDGWGKGDEIDGAQLYECAWADTHSQNDTHYVTSARILFDGVEASLKHHSRVQSDWWVENEPRFRMTTNGALRYLLLAAYLENTASNQAGIAAQLLDAELQQRGQLEYELGELTRHAYPSLSQDIQEGHQELLLHLYDDFADSHEPGDWPTQSVFESFLPIPLVFRTMVTQAFLDKWSVKFTTTKREPRVHMWGGWVGSPVTRDQLQGLSETNLWRLLEHYEGSERGLRNFGEHQFGGRSELCRTIRECAARDAVRYLGMVRRMWKEGLHLDYLHAIIGGVGDHLSYRFGRLKAPGDDWPDAYTQPNGDDLVEQVIELAETYSALWADEWSMARVVEACAHAANKPNHENRITWLLLRLSCSKSPGGDAVRIDSHKRSEPTTHDFRHDAINKPRGIGATAAVNLCCRILKQGREPPELLLPLLKRFSQDDVASVRTAIVTDVPRLQQYDVELGWELIERAYTDPHPQLWPLVESVLYYRLRTDFERVKALLDRILDEVPEIAGETWGRIATLAILEGHLSAEHVMEELERIDAQVLWTGAAQVFATNLGKPEVSQICREGVLSLLARRPVPSGLISAMDRRMMRNDDNKGMVDPIIVDAFIDALELMDDDRFDLTSLLEWMEASAKHDPVETLPLFEKLMGSPAVTGKRFHGLHEKPLIAALLEILREADESDDEDLIRRAIALQDKCLAMEISGMEKMLEAAASLT